MKKNKVLKPLAIMMASSMLLAGTMSIFAEEATPKSETSTATVSFEIDNETTDPVNPVDPTDPTDPGDIDGGNGEGPLAITAFPKAMNFGGHKVGKGTQKFESNLLKPNIQIQDKRGAASDGWNLSVALSDFTNNEASDAGKTTKGIITFNNTTMFEGNNTPSQKQPSNVNNKVVVESGKTTQIASASKGEGLGTWGFHWYAPNYKTDSTNSNVTLEMDTNTVVSGAYSADLEWTLSATPQ